MTTPGWATPEQINVLEQKWMLASEILETTLSRLLGDLPELKQVTGLSDPSIVYDYAHAFFRIQLHQNSLLAEVVGAAALTRLALRGQEINMAPFEEGIARD
jgi:hypothetical protein